MSNVLIVNGWLGSFWGSSNPQHVFTLDGLSRREWVMKGYQGQRHAITEVIAARIAQAIGVNVPNHEPLYLSEDLIEDTPELQAAGFLPGFHVGVEHHPGLDLEALVESPALEQNVLARLNVPDAAAQAVGLVVADTALCNSDHHPGSGNRPVTVSGNVSNIYFADTAAGYVMRPIDFGASMNQAMWGEHSGGAWPDEVMGTVKYFFHQRWLGFTHASIEQRLTDFQLRLSTLDMSLVTQEILASLPQEWRVSNPTVTTGIAQGNPSQADWDDLTQRLTRHQGMAPVTIKAKYDQVGKMMWGVVQR